MLPILSIPVHYPLRLKITSKQTALGCRCKQNVGMSRRKYHKHDPAPFSSAIAAQPRHVTFLTTKTVVRKKPGKQRSDGLLCLDKAVLVQGGGGGDHP